MGIDTSDLLARFLRYVQIDTRSDADSPTTPSTPGQWDLLRLLERELREIGAQEVELTADGYVLATVPSTVPEPVPTIAWFAHVDTATNLPSAAKPIVHRAYDGRPIVLPEDPSQVLSVETTPFLRESIGQDVITASGTTLLGADDKAGVSIVMAAVRHLILNPHLPHGRVRVCFNPDEEIARGVHKLDLKHLGADVAYTLDGSERGEICAESFSADACEVEFHGIASHPGWAKDVMVNALRIAGQFLAALPMDRSPERTGGRDGFIHPLEFTGSAEHAKVRMILRDFELAGLASHHATIERIAAELRAAHPKAKITVQFREQYRNMRYWLEKDPRPVKLLEQAIRLTGTVPFQQPIRGGTDGSVLTQRGLPTPNLYCGMHEVHSQREWVTLQDMEKSAETLIHLARLWTAP